MHNFHSRNWRKNWQMSSQRNTHKLGNGDLLGFQPAQGHRQGFSAQSPSTCFFWILNTLGSGLKRICNETKKLESYKADRMPVFKSTSSQFMTIIYSMEYEKQNTMDSLRAETKLGLSWEQVGTKLGLSWDEVEKLFVTLQRPTSISNLKTLHGWSNSSKFKAKYVTPLIEAQLVCMTHPDKPTNPNQRYLLTENGKLLLANETKTTDAEDNINRLIGKLSEEERNIALKLLQKGIDTE